MTREELVAICEAAIVPESKRDNSDSAAALKQLGICLVLLKAGCEFHERVEGRTIWVHVYAKGFEAFEYGNNPKSYDSDTFYLPTRERLDRAAGGDWY